MYIFDAVLLRCNATTLFSRPFLKTLSILSFSADRPYSVRIENKSDCHDLLICILLYTSCFMQVFFCVTHLIQTLWNVANGFLYERKGLSFSVQEFLWSGWLLNFGEMNSRPARVGLFLKQTDMAETHIHGEKKKESLTEKEGKKKKEENEWKIKRRGGGCTFFDGRAGS